MAGVTLDLQQLVAAPPAVTWALLSDPGLMNRWSSARIESVAPATAVTPRAWARCAGSTCRAGSACCRR